jgi:hypothetical protein
MLRGEEEEEVDRKGRRRTTSLEPADSLQMPPSLAAQRPG